MNKIEVNFITCEPAPPQGYNVQWRVQGSGDPYTDAGNFFISPAVFYDTVNPAGTCYEGLLRSDCGEVVSNPLLWSTCAEESGGGYAIALVGECLPGDTDSSYIITGGTAADIVTVRASFSGILQKNINIFTKACLAISSVYGTSDPELCSTCYEDTSIHSFSLERDVIITMPGAVAYLDLNAVIHNGSESPTSITLTIVDINGTPDNISVSGCRGNSGTGGNC